MKIIDSILMKATENDVENGELRIPDGVTEIAKNACAQNFELERVIIPASVQKINDNAFCECDELLEIEFEGEMLDFLGASAFSDCTSLKQVVLPNIKDMGSYCFEKCENLQMVTLQGAVVGTNCFSRCENLIQVDFLNSDVIIKERAFDNCRGLMYISAPNGISRIENAAFDGCKNLFSLEINSATNAAERAFDLSRIRELNIVDKNIKLTLDYNILSLSNSGNAITLNLGENKQLKQSIYIDLKNNQTYKFDFDDLNTKIKDFSTVHEIVGTKALVEWVNLIAKIQKIAPQAVRLPQAEALITLETDEEKREFVENLGKYNKISGKYRNLNLYDRAQVLKICKLLGVFENDDKQFIVAANTLSKDLPNFIEKMSGENIATHGDANFLIADWFKKIDYPQNFSAKRAKFFIDNYKTLLENNKTDLLAIAINNFDDFAKSINVVTPDKIEQILVEEMSSDVPQNRRELAHLMALQGVVGSEKFTKLSQIMAQAEQNYPNIYDDVVNVKSRRFDRKTATKLTDTTDANFQYEWLEKDSPYNLLIGNICGCCAKLGGAGEDIMYKSATHPDVQTMAIRRKDGEYIGKATVYLNRDKCYAVFNNIELNRNFSSRAKPAQLNEVLDAFLRGVNAFVKAYNRHATEPLKTVTVGADRNKVIDQMRARLPQSSKLFASIDYENYKMGGDSGEQQFVAYDCAQPIKSKTELEMKK